MLCHSKVNKQFKGVEFPCAIKYPFNRRTAPLTFEHVSQGLTHKVHNRASITCFLTSTLFSGDGFTLGRCLLRVPFGEYMLTLSLECKIRMARPYMATIEAMWFQRTSTIYAVDMAWSVVLRISLHLIEHCLSGFVCFKIYFAARMFSGNQC